MTVEQGGFAGAFTQTKKTVVVQAEQRMYPGICRIAFDRVTVGILTVVVVFARIPLTITCTGPMKLFMLRI